MSEDDVRDAVDGSNVVALPRGKFSEQDIHRLNETYALVVIGSRAVVMRENGPDAPPHDRVQFLSVSAFKDITRKEQLKVGERWRGLGELWLENPLRRDYDGIEFVPCGEARSGYYNMWNDFAVRPSSDGDCTLFLAHIEENAARGNVHVFEWMMGWFASIVQRPRQRYGTSLVLRGCQGCGKTFIGEQIGALLAPHYLLLDSPHLLVGQFNNHMKTCLLVQADESFWAGDKQAEGRLKSLVTAHTHMIEGKGVDAIMLPNYVRLMVTSNEDWVVPAGMKERRFAVFDMGEGRTRDYGYFGAIQTQLEEENGYARLLHELLNWNIAPDAVDLRTVPRTEALWHQKERSMDSAIEWLYHRLQHGELRSGKGWETWVATARLHGVYRHYCEQNGHKRPMNESVLIRKLRKIMPGMRQERRTSDPSDEDMPLRPMGWVFPGLDEARAGFDQAVDFEVEWPGPD